MKKYHSILLIVQTVLLISILGVLIFDRIDSENSIFGGEKYEFEPPRLVDVKTSDNPVIGYESALVDLVVFSDFECPYCQQLYSQINNLPDDYIENGLIKITFMNYPLRSHSKANLLAKISEFAYEKDNFEDIYHFLFEHHSEIDTLNYTNILFDYFPDTLELRKYIEQPSLAVAYDLQEAERIGIKGTPVFIVNNVLYLGVRTDDEFENIISMAIAEAETMCN